MVYLTISHPSLWEAWVDLKNTLHGLKHTFVLDIVQEAFDHICETWDGVEVAMFVPDEVFGS